MLLIMPKTNGKVTLGQEQRINLFSQSMVKSIQEVKTEYPNIATDHIRRCYTMKYGKKSRTV